MSGKQYTEKFKVEAVKQATERGHPMAEGLFQLLKRERIRRCICSTREEARRNVFEYIGMFYKLKRRHGYNNRLSPVSYEKQYLERLASV